MNDSVAGTISLFELTWRGMEAIKPVLSGFDTLKSPRAERLSPKQPHSQAARQGTRPLQRGRAVSGDWPGYSAPGTGRGFSVGCSHRARGSAHPGRCSVSMVETPPHLSPECCLCKNIPGAERGLWRWRFTGPIFLIFDGRPGGRRRVAQILYIPSLITSSYETYKR